MTDVFAGRSRLLTVSNRLPFAVSTDGGNLTFNESSGGLATGLRSYIDSSHGRSDTHRDSLWIGWPGMAIEEDRRDAVREKSMTGYHSYPVFLSAEEMEQFYLGFCNKTIWPLFHYFPMYATFQESHWEQYRHVNEVFCDAILQVIRPGDTVWIHDYHLMLLPGLLRKRMPDLPIGFFLHIPFPSFEIFRLLPDAWRRELLEGLLGADLIGFHTYAYTQYFLQCILRILGYENNMGQIAIPGRMVKADTYPMGIDYKKFNNASADPGVQREREALMKDLSGLKTILSVDRLDYTKGVLNRLQGFELLLDRNPQLHGKVVLLMVIVPSRVGVDQYELMKKGIEELVGKVNGKFGNIRWTPILYQFRQLAFEQLAGLYSVSDVALVTPLRDGMNLVAKEYIACRADQTGVLIISEMAGAAKELGEAISINPNHIQEIARALRESLDMPPEEQRRRNASMQNRLRRYDVVRWADEFLDHLQAMKQLQKRYNARILNDRDKLELLAGYRRGKRRLLFLDYDGTLVPFASHPQLAKPPQKLLDLLQILASNPRNTLVLISGRDKGTLEAWFGSLNVNLVAEHGTWMKSPAEEWKLLTQQTSEWKSRILPILQQYADRLPGSFVEEKEFTIVWHYREAQPEHGEVLAGELKDHLVTFTANIDVQVLQGNKVIEVRNAGVNKGTAALRWISTGAYDMMLAVGDDWTDEDLFSVLPSFAYSVKVGITASHARFNLRDPGEVVALLKSLCDVSDAGPDMPAPDRHSAREKRALTGDVIHQKKARKPGTLIWALGIALVPMVARFISRVVSPLILRGTKQ